MSLRNRIDRVTTAAGVNRRLFTVPLLFLLALTGCENPQESIEPTTPEPAAAVTNDRHTSLLLRFNGSLAGVAGEEPSQASGLTFEPGVRGPGVLVDDADRLAYATAGNFKASSGTIEFWIKPTWNGNDLEHRVFFSLEGALVVIKDAGNQLRFILRTDDSELESEFSSGPVNLEDWVAGEWHYIAATWSIPGMMKTYVDGVEVRSHPSRPEDLIIAVPTDLFVGSQDGYWHAPGVFDNLRISGVARTAQEIATSYATDPRIVSLAIEPITNEPFETWRQPAKLRATTRVGRQDYPASQAVWTSSNPAVATVNAEGVIKAVKAGRATITATIGEVQGSAAIRVKAALLPPKVERIHPYLATPASNSLYQMPVVILRYLPTADGVTLDPSVSPDYWELGHITLEDMKRRLDTFDFRVKFMLEEGSRFRGYQNPDALPALGYRVVAAITVYEPLPPGPVGGIVKGLPVYRPDHLQVFQRFDARHYVEDLGVKEFWIWHGGLTPDYPSYDPSIHRPEVLMGMWESNMSSPSTGDISNSDRDPTDLPVYSRSYVVYGQNIWRTEREAIHNHGHQLEAMLTHADIRQDGVEDLFWPKFVGQLGRCGWTEIPPNTTVNYDYHDNYNPVSSDIADWSPEGIGVKTPVSASTWGEHAYPWPLGTWLPGAWERNEAHWYIYWMQSMPGRGNTIPYGADGMENWWRFTGSWDGSITAGAGLVVSSLKPISFSTARDAVRTLKGQVAALVAAGKLSAADGRSLQSLLDSAAQLLDAGDMEVAARRITQFRVQVRSLVESGLVVRLDVQTMLKGTKWLVSRMEAS